MANPKRLAPPQVEQADRWLKEGSETLASIAKKFGCSASTVLASINRMTVAKRKKQWPPSAPEPRTEIAQSKEETSGFTPADVGEPEPVGGLEPLEHAAPLPPASDPELEPPEADVTELPAALKASASMSPDEQKIWYSDRMRQLQADGDKLIKKGNYVEARKIIALAVAVGAALQRLHKDDDQGGFLKLSHKELRRIQRGAKRKILDYLATKRPLHCARCTREVSLEWAKGESTE